MSALEGFMKTWSQAREAFGSGPPHDGAQFDQSARLRDLQSQVHSAAPGSRWTGSASDSYAEANSRQASKLGAISELDRMLGAEVKRSAEVVMAGRQHLDSIRQWVSDAAGALPGNAAGQRALYAILSKGAAEIQEAITRSHGELSSIAGRITGLDHRYRLLGDDEDVPAKGGERLDKVPPIPNTTFDLDDIQLKDGPLGPANTDQIGPGAYYPRLQVGEVPAPPKAPLDYRDIEYRGPFDPGNPATFGRPGYRELIPNSGAWVPDPNAPGFVPRPPEVPVDMAKAHILQPNELVPNGMVALYPGSLIAIPDPDADRPR
jgi:uncharacterized protein YukE